MIKSSSVFAIAAFIALVGCGKKLDNAKLEASITDGLKAKSIPVKSASCPAGREVKAGDSFDCEATTADGEKVAIKVEQKDDEGSIAWKTTGHIGTQASFGSHLVTALGAGATVKCPDKTVVVKKDTTFTCDGVVDGKPAKITFTAKDDQGNFHMSAKMDGVDAPLDKDGVDKE